jgi:hypothetical protein
VRIDVVLMGTRSTPTRGHMRPAGVSDAGRHDIFSQAAPAHKLRLHLDPAQ